MVLNQEIAYLSKRIYIVEFEKSLTEISVLQAVRTSVFGTSACGQKQDKKKKKEEKFSFHYLDILKGRKEERAFFYRLFAGIEIPFLFSYAN